MNLDDHIAAAKRAPLTWDEVRERRVFIIIERKKKLLAERDRRATKRYWSVAAFFGFAATGTLIGLLVAHTTKRNSMPSVQNVSPAASPSPRQVNAEEVPSVEDGQSILGLGKAGRVLLSASAEVSVVARSQDQIGLLQRSGKARYEIIHEEGRSVQVTVEDILIRVVGTVFTVTCDEDTVAVDVDSGTVEIDDGTGIILLNQDEQLQLSARRTVSLFEDSSGGTRHKGITPERSPRRSSARRAAKLSPIPKAVNQDLQADGLFKNVDIARSAGDLSSAVEYLEEIIASGAGEAKKVSAHFTLGKIERRRGRHREAARAFQSCALLYPGSPLAEDALAEAAREWHTAGNNEAVESLIRQYNLQYPDGIHGDDLRSLLR